jgi:hypothetical protein
MMTAADRLKSRRKDSGRRSLRSRERMTAGRQDGKDYGRQTCIISSKDCDEPNRARSNGTSKFGEQSLRMTDRQTPHPHRHHTSRHRWMGTITETANVDYRSSFSNQGDNKLSFSVYIS